MKFVEMAKYYREVLGWLVFPVNRVTKAPLCEHGYKDATTDVDMHDIWSDEFSKANIAAPTGEINGIVVVDIDGNEGRESVKRLAQRGWALPPTATAKTGRGEHRYYQWLEGCRNSAGKLAPGIDVRSGGGSIILPPSIHATGRKYEWVERPDEVRMPLAPLWIARGLVEPKKPETKDADISRFVEEVRHSPIGQRNHALNRAAFICGMMIREGRTREREAHEQLMAAALYAGLHKIEAERTIRSGFGAARG